MKKKILIVDDNPDLISILQVLLKNKGYDTVQAANGRQAVDIATAQLPDLIVMDIMMPRMNGLQAARLIRKNPKTRSIPMLASTAKMSRVDTKECLESGFNDHIAKPFTATQMVSRIEKLMKKKILIVEDNLDIIYIHRRIVQNLGYDFILAVNGKEAVEMAATQLPDLILLDIMLPVMDGLEAARQIRKNPKTHFIPILAVTAKITLEDKEDCLRNGCDDYLPKPFTHLQLSSRIEKLLKQFSGNLSPLAP